MTKYIIGEIFSSGRATLYKNPSDQTVSYNNTYLSLASGYSVKASQRSSLDKENKSEYPTLLTLAVLRLPVLFPGIFKMLTSPNTAPSARVT